MTSVNGDPMRLLVRLAWKTPASSETTSRLKAMQGRIQEAQAKASGEVAETSDEDVDDDSTELVAPVMPSGPEDRIAFVIVRREGEEYAWSLLLAEPPEERDEPTVLAGEAAGGMDAVRGLIEECWDNRPTTSHSLHFHLPTTVWHCPSVPSSVSEHSEENKAVLSISSSAVVEGVAFRLNSGANGITNVRILYGTEGKNYYVDVAALGLVRLGKERWLPFADDVRDVVIGAFFTKKEHASG